MRPLNEHADPAGQIAEYQNWYHRIEVAPGVVTPGVNQSSEVLRRLRLPEDLTGCRVLDLGTRDGFFAFECERRGATVVAVDDAPIESTGFAVAARLLGARVPYVQDNIYRVSARRYGLFDIVLMLGLLYHLPDPLGGLDMVRSVCRDRLFLETQVCDDDLPELAHESVSQFRPDTSAGADVTNYWIPNVTCVRALLRQASFAVDVSSRTGNRATFQAHAITDAKAFFMRDLARGKRLINTSTDRVQDAPRKRRYRSRGAYLP